MRKSAIVLGTVALAVATWQASASLLFLAALGFWSTYPWPDRLWMWALYALEAPPNAIVHRWLAITASVPILLALLLAVPFIAQRRKGGTTSLYGKTGWANTADMQRGGIDRTKRL